MTHGLALHRYGFHAMRALVLLASLLTAAAVNAAGVIDTVQIEDSENPATIRVDFNIPLQYINHAPELSGDEIQIQFRQVSNSSFSLQTTANEQQTVTASPSRYVPLLDARFLSVGSERGVLTLRFSREIEWEIYPGADRRHVLIKVVTANNPVAEESYVFKQDRTGSARRGEKPRHTLMQHYVVNLESFLEGRDMPALKSIPGRKQYIVYTTKFPIDGRVWNRLRIGFFTTRNEAELLRKKLIDQYPGAWVAYASADEIDQAMKDNAQLSTPTRTPAPRPLAILPKTSDAKIQPLMEQARTAVATGDNRRAISLYTKVLQFPENRYSQDALEFLGLARERNQQFAHAINEYKRYLSLYPEGEGAERVKQRLAGLTTASRKPEATPTRSRKRSDARPWEVYGGFSQFYRRDELTTDAAGDTVTQSSISNDLDVTARKRASGYDIQSRFTGSYLHDFLDDGSGSSTSISSLYVDASERRFGLSARVGRQSRNTGGVLGRFDGLLAGVQARDWLKLNAVAGFPVFSTRDTIKTDRYLYGLSADLGTFANAWDFNTFIVEQQNDGILDRRAIGGEARYFDPVKSLLTFIDYDISYDSLNTLIVLGTWTLPDRTTLNASVDYRNSPILTTANALQGQTVPDIDALLDRFSESEIRQLAEDRTAELTTLTLGASHPLTTRLQINGDVTLSNLSGTDASGGVEALESTGNEYFYNVQLIGSNLLINGDINVLGLRYSDTSSSRISTLSLDTRYPIRQVWRINPRVRFDYRDNSSNDSTQWTAAPSLRIDYRWHRRFRLEAEAGGEWSTQELTTETQDSSSFFFSLGYRADF